MSEPYAYFPYTKNKAPITLFDYIDKKMQGEIIRNYRTVSDLKIKNIFFYPGFKKRSNRYFKSLYDFISLIENYPSNHNNQKDLLLKAIKSNLPDSDYLENQKYLIQENWEINKAILFGSKESDFFHLFQNTNKFFFLIGLETNLSFDEVNEYVDTLFRLDYTTLCIKGKKIENEGSIQKRIIRTEDINSIISTIIGYSCIALFEQKEIIKAINKSISTNKNRQAIKKSYYHMLFQKKYLMSYVNSLYYNIGRQERKRYSKFSDKKLQEKENEQRFHAPNGIMVDSEPVKSTCINCGDKDKTIYHVDLYTPFKHTVISGCLNCLSETAKNLSETMMQHYTTNQISSQLMVNYRHSTQPITKCHNCGQLTKYTFEFITVRQSDSVILCKSCIKELLKKIQRED